MDLENIWLPIQNSLSESLPTILGALLILIIGFFVALAIRAGIRRGTAALRLNERVYGEFDVETFLSKAAFWIVIAFTLIGVFNILDLTEFSGPLDAFVTQVMAFIPRFIAAAVVAVVGWAVAKGAKTLTIQGLARTSFDEQLSRNAGMKPVSSSIANVAYWLVILLFLPIVLGILGLEGLLDPLQRMMDQFLAALPDIFAALIIGFVGWIVAKIVREVVRNLAASAGVDRAWSEAGVTESTRLSDLLSLIAFLFVLIPALIAAFERLDIRVISDPATHMLGMFLTAIPNIIAAAIILTITWYVARFVARLLTDILRSTGFDQWPARLGMSSLTNSEFTLSVFAGRLVVFFAMLFATVEAANRLGFQQVRELVSEFIQFAGQILLGSIIILIGVWLANIAHKGLVTLGGAAQTTWAGIARVAIIGIVLAMGLRAMGIADDIVNLAFALTLGAVAVAVALSFGLGGRDAAGEQMAYWLRKLRNE